MLNRNPSTNTSDVLNSYRKRRQQRGPFLVYGAIALVVIGILLIVFWLFGSSDKPFGGLFPTDTPTPTLTFTPTNTPSPTTTPTETLTPTVTLTATPSGPVPYTIVEGDTLFSIAEKFNLGDDGILLIYFQNPQLLTQFGGDIQVGQTIEIPPPGTILPTTTPIPSNLTRGTKIEYRVLAGDTLAGIAARFNSLEQNIIDENKLENPNSLQIGQVLQIPVNLVTATATLSPSSTPVTPTVAGASQSTPTITTGVEPVACTFEENAAFVTELQDLINKARTTNGLPALNLNTQLTAAAKAHAIDMLCNNYLSHNGLDGSTPQTRVKAQGFTVSLVVENLYALSPAYGGNPQFALNWWMNNPAYRADILNPNTTLFGVAYVSSEKSLFGGYFVVISAKS